MGSQQQQALSGDNIYKDISYKLAKAIRNVEGKSPSSIGPEIGQILCALRCLDGARYDSEVLLIGDKNMISLKYHVKVIFEEGVDQELVTKLEEWTKTQPTNMDFHVEPRSHLFNDPYISCICATAPSAIRWQSLIKAKIEELGGYLVDMED